MGAVPLRSFVRRARGKVNKASSVELRVTDMTARDAAWWDIRFGPIHLQIPGRADRFWPWSTLLPLSYVVQRYKGRWCRPLVTWARADNNQFVRVGMSIVIEAYPHLDVNFPGNAHFISFMAAADENLLIRRFQMSNPPSLARVLIDHAIVLSLNAALSGRIGLYSAKAGGAPLLSIYVKCGLKNLPSGVPLPVSVGKASDGRFFFTDDQTSQALAAALDADR